MIKHIDVPDKITYNLITLNNRKRIFKEGICMGNKRIKLVLVMVSVFMLLLAGCQETPKEVKEFIENKQQLNNKHHFTTLSIITK